MQPCAKVSPKILATLANILRSGCEFGIDFEIALGMRRHLQKLYGFPQLPSLCQSAVLCSDLLIVALANIAVKESIRMRELEQWLDFLIDFYFQESGNGLHPSNSATASHTPEFQIRYSKSEQSIDRIESSAVAVDIKTEESENVGECGVEITEEVASESAFPSDESGLKQEPNGDPAEVESSCKETLPTVHLEITEGELEVTRTSRSSSLSSSECVSRNSGVRTPQDDESLISQQMAAALESYRRQKRLQTRIINTQSILPQRPKVSILIDFTFLQTTV